MKIANFSSLFVLLVFFLLSPAGSAETAFLKGKVLDNQGNPVKGAQIIIHNDDTHKKFSGRSDGNGGFAVEHPHCSTLSFDVNPARKTGLSSAHYKHITGDSSKHFIVQLQKGFHVKGRVLAEGQGVKGLEIKIVDQSGESQSNVHGGGKTKSDGNGEFNILLTPGKKTIQIKNHIYSNLSPIYQHEILITGDTELPDMTLPLKQ